jgi:hypothetical protein
MRRGAPVPCHGERRSDKDRTPTGRKVRAREISSAIHKRRDRPTASCRRVGGPVKLRRGDLGGSGTWPCKSLHRRFRNRWANPAPSGDYQDDGLRSVPHRREGSNRVAWPRMGPEVRAAPCPSAQGEGKESATSRMSWAGVQRRRSREMESQNTHVGDPPAPGLALAHTRTQRSRSWFQVRLPRRSPISDGATKAHGPPDTVGRLGIPLGWRSPPGSRRIPGKGRRRHHVPWWLRSQKAAPPVGGADVGDGIVPARVRQARSPARKFSATGSCYSVWTRAWMTPSSR